MSSVLRGMVSIADSVSFWVSLSYMKFSKRRMLALFESGNTFRSFNPIPGSFCDIERRLSRADIVRIEQLEL